MTGETIGGGGAAVGIYLRCWWWLDGWPAILGFRWQKEKQHNAADRSGALLVADPWLMSVEARFEPNERREKRLVVVMLLVLLFFSKFERLGFTSAAQIPNPHPKHAHHIGLLGLSILGRSMCSSSPQIGIG